MNLAPPALGFGRVPRAVLLTVALAWGSATIVAADGAAGAVTVTAPAVRGDWVRPSARCDIDLAEELAADQPGVNQLVVMATDSFAASTGSVFVASRRGTQWVCDTTTATARFGRNGTRPLRDRRSGDGTTPAGFFPLGVQTAWDGQEFSMFGNRADPGHLNAEYRRVQPEDCWGATPNKSTYQKLYRRQGCPGPDDEWLPRFGDVYAHAAVIGANMSPVSGDEPGEPAYAAAIYLHRNSYSSSGSTKPTSGCVSLPLYELIDVLQAIDPDLNPRFAIGPTGWLTQQAG